MVVQVDALAVALLGLLACLIALGLVQVARNLSQALLAIISGTVGKLPFLGGLVGKGIDWIERHIVSAMTSVINGLEGNIGFYWHALGNLATSIGNEILGLSVAFDSLVAYVVGVIRPWVVHTVIGGLQHGVRWLRAEVAKIKTTVYHVANVVEHPFSGPIRAGVIAALKPIAGELAGLERWVQPKIKALEHDVGVVIPRDIAGLRARTRALDRFYERLWKQVKRLDKITVGSVFAGAVAIALGRLGAGWIRCGNWSRIGRGVCRLPTSLIESLLGDAIEAFLVTRLCDFIGLASLAAERFEPLLLAFVDVEDVLIGCNGASKPPPLPLVQAALPPVTGFAALAA